MASGEILLEGAVAYLVGEADQGLKQMMEQVNLSRLSHGVRAAAMMRRCVNEAMAVRAQRAARSASTIIDYPLLRRQLLKIIAAGRTVAVDVPVRRRRDGPRQCRLQGCRGLPAHPDAAAEIPRLPRQYSGGDRRDGGARRQRLHRGMGARRGWCATPISACSGRAPATSTRSTSSRAPSARAARTSRWRRRWRNCSMKRGDSRRRSAIACGTRSTARLPSPNASRPSRRWKQRAAGGQRALSHHQRRADDLGGRPPGADARRALFARLVLEHRLGAQDPLAPEERAWETPAAEVCCRSGTLRLPRLLNFSPCRHSGAAALTPARQGAHCCSIIFGHDVRNFLR